MKTVTSFSTLMLLASKLGQAKKEGNISKIEQAQKEHDDYKKLCLKSNEMVIGYRGDIE